MKRPIQTLSSLIAGLAAGLAFAALAQAADPLPSWVDGATKSAIVGFVEAVTEEGGSDYVAPEARIAILRAVKFETF